MSNARDIKSSKFGAFMATNNINSPTANREASSSVSRDKLILEILALKTCNCFAMLMCVS